jgi:hypothetical protein
MKTRSMLLAKKKEEDKVNANRLVVFPLLLMDLFNQ